MGHISEVLWKTLLFPDWKRMWIQTEKNFQNYHNPLKLPVRSLSQLPWGQLGQESSHVVIPFTRIDKSREKMASPLLPPNTAN